MTDASVGPAPRLGRVEFIALLALSMSLAALGIDLMLPAFPVMRAELGLPDGSPAITATVTAYFAGLAVGQLLYGPLADRYGRKPALLVGYAVYAVGAAAAALSPTLATLVAARLLWGLGAAGPAVVTRAMVRDTFDGDAMARVLSLVVAVFVLVPVVAPSIGAAVVAVVSWRWLFAGCLLAVGAMALWSRRLPETLAPEHRTPLRAGPVLRAARAVVSHRRAMAYTAALTALYGAFTSYLASSENLFGGVYGRPGAFPLIFGGLAAVIGAGMLVNARLVPRVGTLRMAHAALFGYLVAAAGLLGLAVLTDGRPPLWAFVAGMAALLAGHALLVPNLTTAALDPLGHVAGTASSIVGAAQLGVGAALGAVVDRAFDGTVLPLAVAFLGFGVLALLLVLVAEQGRLFGRLPQARPRPSPTAAG